MATGAAPSGFHVLVVDDEPLIVGALCDLVRLSKYRVSGVGSGKEALEVLEREPVHLVLTDLMMPGMNGWQLLATIREQYPATHVIVITGFIPENGRAILTDRHADGYLVKPVDKDRLRTLLAGLLFPQNLGRQAEVVVVDDDPASVAVVEASLTRRGLFVEGFRDPGQALLRVRDNPPDLVVVDILLKGSSGFDFCRQMRRDADGRSVAVVMITAEPSREHVAQAMRMGVDGFVAKPFSPDELADKVLKVLRQKGIGR